LKTFKIVKLLIFLNHKFYKYRNEESVNCCYCFHFDDWSKSRDDI